jgi:hypothetical protein
MLKGKSISIKELRELKRELSKLVWACDDWTVDAYFKGFDKFKERLDILNNRKLSDLDITEIKLINFINRLSMHDIEFMMKEL